MKVGLGHITAQADRDISALVQHTSPALVLRSLKAVTKQIAL